MTRSDRRSVCICNSNSACEYRKKRTTRDIAAHHVTYTTVACDSREEEALHEDQGIFTRTYDLRERDRERPVI